MKVKDLVNLLLECPSDSDVKVFVDGYEADILDCDHTSIITTLTCE